MSWELTDGIKNHKVRYDGNWDVLYCSKCHNTFYIGADMCDSTKILSELERIDKIPCKK